MIFLYNYLTSKKKQETNKKKKDDDNNGIEEIEEEEEKTNNETTGFSGVSTKTVEGRNLLAINIVGLVAAFDYSATLMTLQPMYFLVGGQPSLYGLCLGIYDLAFIIAAPFCAIYLERTKNYKFIFIFSMILSIIGNLLYALIIFFSFGTALSSNAWILMFIARAIMGFGSVNIVAGSTFITKFSKFEHRLGRMGSYQNSQVVSRMVGPMIGFIFLALPFPVPGSDTAILLFNFYTICGWLMFIISLIGMILVFSLFTSPPLKDEEEFSTFYDVTKADKGEGSLFRKILLNSIITLIFGFVDYSILGQLFAFGTAQFQVVANQYDMWKPYIGVGVGSIVAVIIWRRIAGKMWDNPRQEVIWCMIGLSFGFATPWFFINYNPSLSSSSPSALMYVGTTLLGASQVLSFSNLEIIFSKQLTQHITEVGGSIGTMFVVYGISQSLARFLGPFVTGFIIPVINTAPDSNGLCFNSQGNFDANSTCCFTPTAFATSTCELLYVDIYIPILTALAFLNLLLGIWFLFHTVNYGAKNQDIIKEVIKDEERQGLLADEKANEELGLS